MENSGKLKKQRVIIVLLVILLFLLLFLLMCQCEQETVPGQTAVIEQDTQTVLTDAEKGAIRIKINPVINIKNGTMQNMNFCNYNEDRLLRCKIKFGEEYIYDSGFVSEGSILKGDFIRTDCLKSGENEAVAEVYSYSPDEKLIGQTNVKITLDLSV